MNEKTNDTMREHMRRYAAAYNARRNREDRMRRAKLRIRICMNAAQYYAGMLWKVIPMEAKCILCAFAGAQVVLIPYQMVMMLWFILM